MLDQLNVTNERPLVQLAAEVGVIEKLKKRIPNRLKESPSRFPASEIGASSNFRARITPLGHRHLPGFVHGLEFRYRHLGCDRVGNETILVCGMVHFAELFCTGRSIPNPGNLRAKLDTSNGHFPFGIFLHMANRLVLVRIEHELLFTRNRQKRKHVTARE